MYSEYIISKHFIKLRNKFIVISLILIFASFPNYSQNFIDIYDSTGLQKYTFTNGIAMSDYDLDGDLDIYIVGALKYDIYDESNWNRFYRNEGNGKYIEVTEEANVRGPAISPREGSFGSQFGAAWGDYDNDNDPDLYLTNYGYNFLYKNNGDGTFTDISLKAGVRGPINDQHSSACWWDYDLDGDLDLYASAYIGRNLMFENVGQDSFTNVTVKSGLGDRGLTWTAMPFDANNDFLPDLYVVNDFGANKFYLNKGDGSFVESTSEFGLEDEGHGMGITLGDYDNDGDFDIYLTNISSQYPCPLFQNQSNGTFTNIAEEMGVSNAGWAWGTEFFDFDNDGALDLYSVNGFVDEPGSNYLFYNLLEREFVLQFRNISDSSGANSSEEARSLVTFDYDDDGDLDMIVGNWFAYPHFYKNISESENWIKIKLKGTTSNRDAYGSSVKVTCGEKNYYRSNDGIDFLGQSLIPLHFGLGNANIIDSIIITWPGGEKEKLTSINVNQNINIIENEGIVNINDRLNISYKENFRLIGNYPNPFNNSTKIEYSSKHNGIGKFNVIDLLGRLIYENDLQINSGLNVVMWNGVNTYGSNVSTGIYIYSIQNENNKILLGKLVLLK